MTSPDQNLEPQSGAVDSDQSASLWRRLVVPVAVASLALAGCGEGDVDASPETTQSTTQSNSEYTVPETTTTTLPRLPEFEMINQFERTQWDGSTFRVTFEIGDAMEMQEVDQYPRLDRLFQACHGSYLDDERDAVVPFRTTVTSTTEDFNVAGPKIMTQINAYESHGMEFSRMIDFGGGSPACGSNTEEISAARDDIFEQIGIEFDLLTPEEPTRDVVGMLVLHNFYQPANPEGVDLQANVQTIVVEGGPPVDPGATVNLRDASFVTEEQN